MSDASPVSEVRSPPLVRMVGIVKRFPGVLANDGIDFELRAGEVHALLGENGAGKTTLMNILYGLYHPDDGEIHVGDKRVCFQSPADAIAHGIGMVHQTFRLIPTLTVVENVILGLPSKGVFLESKTAAAHVTELSERYKLDVDPHALVWQLSAGQQQRIEILKALYRQAQVLILDEPTSVLTPYETEGLFACVETMAQEGHGVVFISHKLNEVLRVSDRISVLRDGKLVGTVGAEGTSQSTLACLMVGREVLFNLKRVDQEPGETLLLVEDLCANNDAGLPVLQHISFAVRGGEILGIAGVTGNGQSELAEVLNGLRLATGGRIQLKGETLSNLSPHQLIQRGMAFIPEKVREMAMLPSFSIESNSVLKVHDQPPFRRGWFINQPAISAWAESLMESYDVRAPDRRLSVGKLSGGNLHKLSLASELGRNPEFITAVNPTSGLDVGATEYIRNRLLDERQRGKSVLLISSDLEEIMMLSDRIAVMYRGSIVGVVEPEHATAETMGLLMAGLRPTDSSHLIDAVPSTNRKIASPPVQQSRKNAALVAAQSAKNSGFKLNSRNILHLLTDPSGWTSLFTAGIAISVALLLVGGLILSMHVDPVRAYEALWRSAFGTRSGIGETLVRATPLLFIGLAVLVAYRSGIWNIGAEGQLYAGALGATLAGTISHSLPAVVHLPLVIIAGFLFGAAYGALPGLMRAYRGTNEIISTIMLNYIAVYVVGYLVTGPMRDSNLLLPQPQSFPIAEAAHLPKILTGTRAHAGILLAVLAAALVYILMWKTVIGYRLRAVGENPVAAKFGGINVPLNLVLAMAISGGLAGLAGVGEVAGVRGYLINNLSPGYGYTGIAVALFGGLNPAAVVLAAFFFASLIVGADGLQRSVGVPTATVLVIQGLVLVFVIGRRVLSRVRDRRRA
jgi:ABC-type uncharacterized transport system ATPase subunit/ABC-type uncharacterized transport system permease subunit